MSTFSQEEIEQALQKCAAEPIHQIGQIQPHGAMLVLSSDKHRTVLQASENLADFIDLPVDGVYGKPLTELIGDNKADQIEQLIKNASDNNTATGVVSITQQQEKMNLQARVFVTDKLFVLELIREDDKYQEKFLSDLLLTLQRSLLNLNAEPDTNRYFDRIALIVRELTEFDRVMIYRFDDNWDGEVIAESRVDSALSYLGTRFPASDIPPQARRLYTSNLVRLISDTEAKPVPILPVLNPATQQPLNMTHSVLRSLSPVHVEYLQNMGVRASMSISLLQNGRLWGLIACHHMSPKRMPYALQEASTFISQTVSAKLTLIEVHEQHNLGIEASRIVGKLLKISQARSEDIPEQLLPDLLALIGATGVIMAIEGKHYVHGEVPGPSAVKDLMVWLGSQPATEILTSNQLTELYPASKAYSEIASGIVATPISTEMRNSIVWLRPEKIRTVNWAGNLEKTIQSDMTGAVSLSPRKSFDIWNELWHRHGISWTQAEISTAAILARALTEGLAQKSKLESEIEQRQQTEKNLHSSEIKLDTILDGVAGYIYIKDTNYRYQYANHMVCEMFGKSREEIIGHEDADFFDEETAKRLRIDDRCVIEQGIRVSKEEVNISSDGKVTKAFLVVKIPLRNEDDTIYALCGISTDITEIKRTEKALTKESEKNLALLRNASDGIHILDTEGNVIDASDSFCFMLGYQRDEIIGMNVSRWDAEFTDSELKKAVRQQFEKKDITVFETHHRRRDGTIFDVEVSGFPLELDGTPVLFNSSRDISERKKVEKEIRISAIAFETQEGVIITDANASILRVNKAFTKISGYTPQEVIGKNPNILKSGRMDGDFYSIMWEGLNRLGFWEGEIWNKRKNGEIFPEHLCITAVKDQNGVVTNYVATLTDITMNRNAANQIQQLAFYDTLTHLPNRRLLNDRLVQALASSSRTGSCGALLFLDIDNFKMLNDTLGHDIGDQLLQQTAQRLESCIREGDTVARQGGDEFVVMLEDLSEIIRDAATQTEVVGKKILDAFSKPFQLDKHIYNCTASIGATLFGSKQVGLEELNKQADIAMYQAKKAGRNTLRFFDLEMQANINARATLENELRAAIEKQHFQLFYQVQVDISRRAIGAEALIRWCHPKLGMVSPAQFIPLAEETGLILPIGKWVIDTACAQLKAWQNSDITRHLTLSVNVSGKQFHEAGFVEQVQAAVNRHGINPKLLKLEPTESILLDDIASDVASMMELNKIGVQLALDDFGTGYSSLQYLRLLPLQQLKIDQSFVRELTSDASGRTIVRTIISMAKSLSLDVIAEGVETEEQMQLLLGKGCEHFQGYLFGKPMPIEEFEAALSKQ